MSDYDDLLTNEDDDMSVTESSATSCDWETEEEEQVPGNDTGIESGNLTNRFAVVPISVTGYLCRLCDVQVSSKTTVYHCYFFIRIVHFNKINSPEIFKH
jgi:hypothetical protein